MNKIHETQQNILNLAKTSKIKYDNYRLLGRLLGVDHPQKIKHHLGQLIKKGLVQIDSKTNNIIVLNSDNSSSKNIVAVPIIGSASCGVATVFAEEYIQGYLKISRSILGNNISVKDLIIIQASGDSMNEASINGEKILDGDYVLVDTSKKIPENDDYVLSVIDGMANIKRFVKDPKNKQIILFSESTKNYPPIYILEQDLEDYIVNGKVIKVIKHPKNINKE